MGGLGAWVGSGVVYAMLCYPMMRCAVGLHLMHRAFFLIAPRPTPDHCHITPSTLYTDS